MSTEAVQPTQSTSPDLFLRTRRSHDLPIKPEGLLDTLYQQKESTTQAKPR